MCIADIEETYTASKKEIDEARVINLELSWLLLFGVIFIFIAATFVAKGYLCPCLF